MLRAPLEQRDQCYEKADGSVRHSIDLEDFHGAFESKLAVAGEEAPVLSVSLCSESQLESSSAASTSKPSFNSCIVSFLSGSSFACSLIGANHHQTAKGQIRKGRPRSRSIGSAIALQISKSQPEKQHFEQPAPLQQPTEFADDQGELHATTLTVSQLAKAILAELPKQVEISPVPKRVFIVFSKNRREDEEDEDEDDPVAVTAWDWKRPVTDYI